MILFNANKIILQSNLWNKKHPQHQGHQAQQLRLGPREEAEVREDQWGPDQQRCKGRRQKELAQNNWERGWRTGTVGRGPTERGKEAWGERWGGARKWKILGKWQRGWSKTTMAINKLSLKRTHQWHTAQSLGDGHLRFCWDSDFKIWSLTPIFRKIHVILPIDKFWSYFNNYFFFTSV